MATRVDVRENNRVGCIIWNWLSDADGAASKATPDLIFGHLTRVVFNPDGTDVPTASYDVKVNDEEGVDVLNGAGATLSASATTSSALFEDAADATKHSAAMGVADVLTLVVSAAGAAKKGSVRLYYTR